MADNLSQGQSIGGPGVLVDCRKKDFKRPAGMAVGVSSNSKKIDKDVMSNKPLRWKSRRPIQ